MINERSVLPVATLLDGQYGLKDVVLSLPTVIGKSGAEQTLSHPFTEEEADTLALIAKNVRTVTEQIALKTGLKM